MILFFILFVLVAIVIERWSIKHALDGVKYDIERLMRSAPCQCCNGKRLKKESLSVHVGGKNIWELCEMSVDSLTEFLENLQKFGKIMKKSD